MRTMLRKSVSFYALMGVLSFAAPASAHVPLGTGNASLLGGDLTDPEDDIVDRASYGPDQTEAQLRPEKANWVSMKCFPANPPGTPAHQRHAYQSWVEAPACGIFLNKPEQRRWYVSFDDGGYGGPTEDSPYFAAVQFAQPYVLTHFTVTTGPDTPGRDPLVWAIQGSNTAQDDDWTDVYRCDPGGREKSPLQENPRGQTTLFTCFTSADMAKALPAAEAKKIAAKLGGKAIEKADFARPAGAYTWYRVVIFSCFNEAGGQAGCCLGQLELFGVPGKAAPIQKHAQATEPVGIEPVVFPFDPPFIISYCCGPPSTLERYKEVAECGFNVAWAGWLANTPATEPEPHQPTRKGTRKILDLCQQVGIKALIFDDRLLALYDPARLDEKVLDSLIADFASHPALFGYVLADEPGIAMFPRLGTFSQYLLKKDPKHLPYINLWPNYVNHPDWLGPAYEPTITKYIDTVKPALVSWDAYRQMFEGGDERFYWKNLESMRKLTLKAKIPMIQIIVSIKHMGYRECSEADLRWQVYSSLAYGTRGIIYFTYWDVPGMAWADAPALITMDGKRDAKWFYVQKINRRIAKLGATLTQVTSTGVYHTDPVPPGGHRLAKTGPVKKAEGGPLTIGCFIDRNAQEYILVVNRSFSETCLAKLALNEKILSAAEISRETGKPLAPVSVAGKTLDIPLDPGDGRMYLLSRKK
ncbi:MAG: hypothetical protein NTV86_14080 [Planctomycetota bacterium]|nr:hypothetical protein [Planctomycetota bacterium]